MSITCLELSAVKCFCTLTIPALFSKLKTSDRLNTEFNNLCDWFVDNKLSIHFGEDKTKSILFTVKNCPKADNLNISRGSIKVAQHKETNYLGRLFDEKSSGESMTLR